MIESTIIRYEVMYPIIAVLATFALIIIYRMQKIIKNLDIREQIQNYGLIVLLSAYLFTILSYLQIIFWFLFPQFLVVISDFIIIVPIFLLSFMGLLNPTKRIKTRDDERVILMKIYWIISYLMIIGLTIILYIQRFGYLQVFISIFIISIFFILLYFKSTIKNYFTIKAQGS